MFKKKLSVGLLQTEMTEDTNVNLSRTLRHLSALRGRAPDLLVLPEIFLGAQRSQNELQSSANSYKNVIPTLSAWCKKEKCALYGSIIEASGSQFYNASLWINQRGENQIVYRKKHLFRFDNEHKLFGAGQNCDPIPTLWGPFVPIICYDLRFPEQIRSVILKTRAPLVLVCAQWPASRREHWLTLLRARAIENQCFVVACNRRGIKRGLVYSGDSVVFSPWGDSLLKLGKTRAFGSVQIDLSDCDKIRSQYPFLEDA